MDVGCTHASLLTMYKEKLDADVKKRKLCCYIIES